MNKQVLPRVICMHPCFSIDGDDGGGMMIDGVVSHGCPCTKTPERYVFGLRHFIGNSTLRISVGRNSLAIDLGQYSLDECNIRWRCSGADATHVFLVVGAAALDDPHMGWSLLIMFCFVQLSHMYCMRFICSFGARVVKTPPARNLLQYG